MSNPSPSPEPEVILPRIGEVQGESFKAREGQLGLARRVMGSIGEEQFGRALVTIHQ